MVLNVSADSNNNSNQSNWLQVLLLYKNGNMYFVGGDRSAFTVAYISLYSILL